METGWDELIQGFPRLTCVAGSMNYEVSVGGNCCSLLMLILGDICF